MNVQQHEEKIKGLNERFLAGRMSRQEVETEIAELLGETNLVYKLQERLTQQINQQISPKARERLSTRQYLMKCEEIEEDVIQSVFPYAFFNEATLEEIEQLDPTLLDSKTLMLIVISALRGFIDNEQETEPKVEALHGFYLRLKNSLCALIPEFPKEDGFVDYLKTKQHRTDLEDARVTGSICIFCEGGDVKSYGNKWFCKSCGRYFSKHRAKKED